MEMCPSTKEEEEPPFRGFTEEDESLLYPIVESRSQQLFELVVDLEQEYMEITGQEFASGSQTLTIPNAVLEAEGGAPIQLGRYRNGTEEGPEEEEYDPDEFINLKASMEKVRMAMLEATAVAQTKSEKGQEQESLEPDKVVEEVVVAEKNNTKDYTNICMNAAFSPEELELLRKPMEQGWSREVVLKSVDGLGAGEVNYVSPDGFTVRSYKDLTIQLSKFPLTTLSRQNFSFTARPVGGSKLEFVKLPGESSKWIEKNAELLGNPELASSFEKGIQNFNTRQAGLIIKKRYEEVYKKGADLDSASKANGPSGSKRIGGIQNNTQPVKKSKPESSRGGYVMGTLPPNHPNTSLTNSADDDKNIDVKRRRGRPATKVKGKVFSTEESDEGMFQISALSKLFAGMEEAEMEDYTKMANLMAAQQNVLDQMTPGVGYMDQPDQNEDFMSQINALDHMMGDGEVQGRDEILPCSIRCAGMTGEIPTLQCKRCLCLYHAECLGFPPNLNAANFLCSNCEGIPMEDMEDPQSPESSPERPKKESMLYFMEKMMELNKQRGRRSPVSLPKFTNNSFKVPSRLPGFLPIGKGGMSVKRMETSGSSRGVEGGSSAQATGLGNALSISSVNPKRGRGGRRRGGKLAVPQISRNLTITPISIPIKGQLPRVPNLAPINGSARSTAPNVPMFRGGRRGRGRGRQLGMVPTYGMLDGYGQASTLPNDETKMVKGRYPMPTFGTPFGAVKPPPPNMFRRYPQSVVTVGQKKFIAVPSGMALLRTITKKKPEPEVPAELDTEEGPFGTNSEVLNKVFPFLAAKDLLNASVVSRKWQEEARKQWRIVRLKNTRIYDLEAFAEFIAARNSEVIDFRKMLGSIDWASLFVLLGKIGTLHSFILGPRSLDLVPLIQEHCPDIRVIQN